MFFRKKSQVKRVPAGMMPVIHASICTGEQAAGFEDASGRFEEVMLIRDEEDLRRFAEEYGIDPGTIKKKY